MELGDNAAGIADIGERGANGGPIDVAIAEIHPGVAVVAALEILEMDLDGALAESANPILRIAIEHHVADVEPGLNPRRVKFIDIGNHFERAEQKFIPDFFDGDDDFELFGEREELADLRLRARPGIAVRSLRIENGGNEKNSVRAPELRVVERNAHAVETFVDDGGIGGRE